MKKLLEKIVNWLYFPIFRKFIPYDLFRYLFCGGLNALLDVLLYAFFYHVVFGKNDLDLGFVVLSGHIAALFATYPIVYFTGFWMMNNVALKGSPVKTGTKMLRYLSVGALNVVLNYAGLKLFVDVLHFYPTPSKAALIIITAVISFLLQKNFSFRNYQSN